MSRTAKYGYDVAGGTVGITAARSPVCAWHDPEVLDQEIAHLSGPGSTGGSEGPCCPTRGPAGFTIRSVDRAHLEITNTTERAYNIAISTWQVTKAVVGDSPCRSPAGPSGRRRSLLFEGEQATSPRRHGRSNSYQLFERCATDLSTIPRTLR